MTEFGKKYMIYDTWDESNVVHVGYGESVFTNYETVDHKTACEFSSSYTFDNVLFKKHFRYVQVDMLFKTSLQLYDKPLFDR